MILTRLQFSEKKKRVINCVDTFKCNYYNKPLCSEVRKRHRRSGITFTKHVECVQSIASVTSICHSASLGAIQILLSSKLESSFYVVAIEKTTNNNN